MDPATGGGGVDWNQILIFVGPAGAALLGLVMLFVPVVVALLKWLGKTHDLDLKMTRAITLLVAKIEVMPKMVGVEVATVLHRDRNGGWNSSDLAEYRQEADEEAAAASTREDIGSDFGDRLREARAARAARERRTGDPEDG